ncbi:hypothetical protein [Amycolatopsis saalfeldensis]|uniref:Low temperature requirement A protein (LtrA) n=1 Tax=Amycolatopsis saalfeldensis TaxID=394193 RepID=A0A1H8T2K7_9PSEU|nr:hypothetical protein [Amycolatopsis saalfeldensis]SEO84788.1 hypothetical protein SAMN04489732_102386 [Amycolatopsis saalfeldensis]
MAGRQLRIAQVIMFAQAVASLGIWVVQVLTISDRLGHGQDVDGSVWLVIVVNPLIAILVALAAGLLTRRSWARGLALCMETVGAVSAVVSVTTGYYQAVVAILLAIGVMVLVASGTRRSAQAA